MIKRKEKKRHLCFYLAQFGDLNSEMFSMKRKKVQQCFYVAPFIKVTFFAGKSFVFRYVLVSQCALSF